MGFGVDSLTGDFKIVLIYCYASVSSSFAVYTSRNHSWKYLEQKSLRDNKVMVTTHRSNNNTFLNGYYYRLKHNVREYSSTILAFDMHNEIFEETKTPAIQVLQQFGILHLLNDSLALVSQIAEVNATDIEIWLMEGKGQLTFFLSVVVPFVTFDVFRFWGGNKILLDVSLEDVSGMIMCDFDSLDVRLLELEIGRTDWVEDFIPMYYKESLFAIKGKDGIEDYDTRSPEGLEHLGYQGPFTKIGCALFRGEANLGRKDCDDQWDPRDYSDEEVKMLGDIIGYLHFGAECDEEVDSDDPNEPEYSVECVCTVMV